MSFPLHCFIDLTFKILPSYFLEACYISKLHIKYSHTSRGRRIEGFFIVLYMFIKIIGNPLESSYIIDKTFIISFSFSIQSYNKG